MAKWSEISSRQRLWVLTGLLAVVFVGYMSLRFLPKHRLLSQQNVQLQADKEEVAHPRYPDAPDEDLDELRDTDESLKFDLETYNESLKVKMQDMAKDKGQETLLKVSELARNHGVKIVENVPYPTNHLLVSNTDTKATPNPPKRRKRKKDDATVGAAPNSAQGVIDKEGLLVYQVVNLFDEPRPLQAMTLEGSFFDLKHFFQALNGLPIQVTVVRLDLTMKAENNVQGTPQLLAAKLLVAM